MLITIATISALQDCVSSKKATGKTIGLVPTMGALHQGHLSLIKQSKQENDVTVCSIFVNPTQFNDPLDLQHYPRPEQADQQLLSEEGCDILFKPEVPEMYSPGETWDLNLGSIEQVLEGQHRPGHYRGVTQIVNKLFTLIQPHRAYFGQKDYQQFIVIQKLVDRLRLPVHIVCHPTVRAHDGLALSSRNVHLNIQERAAAPLIYQALLKAQALYSGSTPSAVIQVTLDLLTSHALLKPEYFVICHVDTLAPLLDHEKPTRAIALTAVRIGNTRLLDNLFIQG